MCCVRLLSQATIPHKPTSFFRLDHIPYTPLVYAVCIQLMAWALACPAPIYHHPHVPSVTLPFWYLVYSDSPWPCDLDPTVLTSSDKLRLVVSVIVPTLCPFSRVSRHVPVNSVQLLPPQLKAQSILYHEHTLLPLYGKL